MMNLSFVGLSDDGSALILSSQDGRRYALAIDERLRSATRSGRSTRMDSPDEHVGAKEIQARMRAGATPEEVAEFADWSVDRVTAFAAPVLQERSWIAEKAQNCPTGRDDDDPSLGEIVLRRLGERGIDETTTRWDAWLREDGAWMILLAYPAGQGDRVATWSFDPSAKTLVSLDDEARWFTEDRVPEESRPRLVSSSADSDARVSSRRPSLSANHPAGRAQHGPDSGIPSAPATPDATTDEAPETPAKRGTGKSRRKPKDEAPTWDEVLFGAPPDESGR